MRCRNEYRPVGIVMESDHAGVFGPDVETRIIASLAWNVRSYIVSRNCRALRKDWNRVK